MILKTLINRCHKFQYFKYSKKSYFNCKNELIINLLPKISAKPRCSKCKKISPGYDTQAKREFLFIPIWGYKVKIINTIKQARTYLNRGAQVDAIILDIMFRPESNTSIEPFQSLGYEYLLELKDQNSKFKDTPVIMYTVRVDIEMERRCLSVGAFDYILKNAGGARILEVLKKAGVNPPKQSSKRKTISKIANSIIISLKLQEC